MPYDRNGNWTSDNSASSQYDANAESRQGDTILDQIPIIRSLTGSSGRLQSYQDALNSDRNRAYWDSLSPPSIGDLTSQQGVNAEQQALQNISGYARGGPTSADQSGMEAVRAHAQQQGRAAQGAIQQQAQARGMGGSGLDFATRNQAAQGAQGQAADAESQMMQGAQQRALAATAAQGQLGSRMRQEALQGPQQAQYQDLMQRAAGATGQYGTDVQAAQRGRDRQQQSDAGFMGLLSNIFD